MRETKFRAWDTERQRFLAPDEIAEEVLVNPYRDGSGFTLHSAISPMKNRLEFPQYTGLKDKNDRETCEGDILQAAPHHKRLELKFVVEYNLDWGHWILRGNDSEEYAFFKAFVEELEGLGNIYENPELLEEIC